MIRPFNFHDIPVLEKMLADEGLPASEMGIKQGLTYVLEDYKKVKGFFTFKAPFEKQLYLVHFCTAKEYRSMKLARDLAKGLINTVRGLKVTHFILNCPKANKGLKTIMKYYFKKDFYSEYKDHLYMKVEV